MFLNEHEKTKEQEISKNEQKPEKHKEVKVEAVKTALKATILFAKLAQAKAEENVIQLWTESFPDSIQSFTEPTSGLPFWVIVFMIFIFALLTDSTLAWMMIYPYLHRVTLVESRHGFLPRPSFLTHPLPEHDPSTERSTAPQPRRREPMMGAASTSAAEPAAAASTSAAVPAAAASTSAVPAAAASSSTLCLLLWLFRALGILRLLRALGITRLLRALALIGVLSRLLAGWTLQLLRLRVAANQGPRRRNGRSRAREISLLVTPMDQRYHCDSECRGLRNARPLSTCARCPQCGPVQSIGP